MFIVYVNFPLAALSADKDTGMFWREKSGVTPARSDTLAAVPACQESLGSCPEPSLDPELATSEVCCL